MAAPPAPRRPDRRGWSSGGGRRRQLEHGRLDPAGRAIGTDLDERHLRRSPGGVAQLFKLIEAVLDLANLDGAQTSMQVEPLDIAQLISAVSDSFADEAERAGAALIVDCDEARLTVPIAADRRRLSQIPSSLVLNAIIYNRPGGVDRPSMRWVSLSQS
ncbi:MAG TPA: hypothetical protein VGI79_19065 [Caulobacteraceae bacterium]|jgi:signal transduction histidine kinase